VIRLFRILARGGRDSDVWPIVLLLFAVLVPAVCLLWFMSAAMRNERFAARQKLEEVYRGQLAAVQADLDRHWKEAVSELDDLAQTNPASVAFAKCVQSRRMDSVLIFDGQGRIAYPNTPTAFDPVSNELEVKWAEANGLEYLRKDYVAAASRYEALSKEATNVNATARALQAQARCLVQAGRTQTAIGLVDEILAQIPTVGSRVLDVACGEGGSTHQLAEYVSPAAITAIGISHDQLTAARKRAPGSRFSRMDASRLGFADSTFDTVLCIEAAFHFNTREDFLKEAFRVLKPGGYLALSDLLMALGTPLVPGENHVPTPRAYRELLERCGFVDIVLSDATQQTWRTYRRRVTDYLIRESSRKADRRRGWPSASAGCRRPVARSCLRLVLGEARGRLRRGRTRPRRGSGLPGACSRPRARGQLSRSDRRMAGGRAVVPRRPG